MPEWNKCDLYNLEQQILRLVNELKENGYLRKDYQFRTRQIIHQDFENMMRAFVKEADEKD